MQQRKIQKVEFFIEMDHRKAQDLPKSVPVTADSTPTTLLPKRHPKPRHRGEVKAKDSIAARKVQKANREKFRRNRLNEHFFELGNTLDPDRPNNDKATILTDTIQILKDLTGQVHRLKTEHASLSEESIELMQEKNELREEKASFKSDIENLNAQYQQRVRFMFPWTSIDHSYPVPMPLPPSSISIHRPLYSLPLFQNQNPSPSLTYVPFSAPAVQTASQCVTMSDMSSKQEYRSNLLDHERPNNAERCGESNDVATELELKMPGSSAQHVSSCGARNGMRNIRDESASSR